MNIDQDEADRLVTQPSETRDTELKGWIDPRTPPGTAKLLTAIFALRNFNGGRLIIGFNDKTQQPEPMSPSDVLDAFHPDRIQALVTKHASEAFDVAVALGQRGAGRHPVIVVASGVRTPVAVKVPVTSSAGKQILKKGTVFFRTLHANGTVSSAELQPEDWPDLMQIVMDNREADIGRFVRRHLSGLDIPQIYAALQSLSPDVAVTLLQ